MNVANRTLYVADNLRVLRGIDTATVDLIATDPPFNSKRSFNAPLGSPAAKQRFDDRWRWDDVTDEWHDLIAADHPAVKEVIEAAVVIEGGRVQDTGIETGAENSIAAFLTWMAPRVIEMRRVLKPTGSIYLHCDDAANAYLRLLLDAVFGRTKFRNEIVWQRIGNHNDAGRFGRTGDRILFYGTDIRRDATRRAFRCRNATSSRSTGTRTPEGCSGKTTLPDPASVAAKRERNGAGGTRPASGGAGACRGRATTRRG